MKEKLQQFMVQGMQRDLSPSKFNPNFAFENMNIRITARDKNTLLSVTNEQGNKRLTITGLPGDIILGTYLGHGIINNIIIIFTAFKPEPNASTVSKIYRLIYDSALNKFNGTLLFSGNLGFDRLHPIETLCIYENGGIQKVYWVDGLNQPRVINIAPSVDHTAFTINSFNFVQSFKHFETVSIARNDTSNGIFSTGTIQYAFTYYTKYMQESNIFYSSSLYYISPSDRGGSSEETVNNSFNITLTDLDTDFDYLRIYSIHRTSIDATPIVLNVAALAIPNSGELFYIDTGNTGSSVDPSLLLYIGGEDIIAKTIAQKDNTLFLGNITLNRKLISTDIKELVNRGEVTFTGTKHLTLPDPIGFYPYKNNLNLNSNQIKAFKYLEWYRFGIIAQHSTGKWSEVIWVNDIQNDIHPSGYYARKTDISLAMATYNVNSNIINSLISKGYTKIKGVVCYPKLEDRNVIAQGMLCPTVANIGDRFDNSPFVQSSWFARPNLPYDITKTRDSADPSIWMDRLSDDPFSINSYTENSRAGVIRNKNVTLTVAEVGTKTFEIVNKGSWPEFRHNICLSATGAAYPEVQSILGNNPGYPCISNVRAGSIRTWISVNKSDFFVDQSILTFHSPEIEFGDISNLDNSQLKLRIIGIIPLTGFVGDIDIQTSTPPNNFKDSSEVAPGFYKEGINAPNISRFGCKQLISGSFWLDELSTYKSNTSNSNKLVTGFLVYPWHRNGSLNNCRNATNSVKPAMLYQKKISNNRYSYNSFYFNPNSIWNSYIENSITNTGISGVNIFNSNEVSLLKIPSPLNSNLPDLNYYGNVDKVVSIQDNLNVTESTGYRIKVTGTQSTSDIHDLFVDDVINLTDTFTDDITGIDPTHIKYKSTPHAVLALNYTTTGQPRILPTINDGDVDYFGTTKWPCNIVSNDILNYHHLFWDEKKTITNISQDIIDYYFGNVNNSLTGYGPEYGFFWLGELYRDEVTNRFGGQTEEAFENNTWLPCGEAVSLLNYNGTAKTSVTINYTEGDTYYSRYDCLKTYPYTLADQNSVVDIVSFMCETRINLDGRYDKNRGLTNNLVMTPTNFNLFNKVYNQSDNFFNYNYLNSNKLNLSNFPTTITWSTTKTLGSLIDVWTNITVASTLDMDGDKGEVVAIKKFNNNLFCFQEKGISQILFNSRVQINTSESVPIEIANSAKVDGKIYMIQNTGCVNKWSIITTPNGMYFIDNNTSSLLLFDGNNFTNISDKFGYRTFINQNNSLVEWNASTFNNFIGFYDANNGDIYFTNKNYCLGYSELLNQFTSFYNYEATPLMFNMEGKFFSCKNDYLWEQNAGNYNSFFGETKPYYTTIISNSEEPLDKIFTNIEFRADTWNGSTLLDNITFDTLEVWTEYQKGTSTLTSTNDVPSTLKKKFRIWRALIPRDDNSRRDRIRNPWAFIKLTNANPSTYRTELHDIIVHYYE